LYFEPQELAKNIFYFKNAIYETNRLIDFIEKTEDDEEIDNSIISKWIPWTSSNNVNDIYGYKKNINGREKTLSPKELYIYNSIRSSMIHVASEYQKYNNVTDPIYISKEFDIKKYNTGQMMGPHADQNDGDTNLNYSIVAYLNDNYEGGEISFPNHNAMIKPEAGSIIVFPSADPYLHESKEITSGIKYMSPGFWTKQKTD
jgi:predicted 2-oxoglutarate/Fe(II)-dependent dioxygenase YbiX